jgi:hypothetical protein
MQDNSIQSKINCIGATVFLSLLILPFCGCSLTGNMLDWKGDSSLDNYVKWRDTRVTELNHYIGKTKEEIKEIFGEPNRIDYSVKYKGNLYTEEWEYKHENGITLINPNQCVDLLYFNNNRLVFVEVL